MNQKTLFDSGDPLELVHDHDPQLVPEDKPRLNRQCHAILARLREGTASNTQLVTIALRYSARIKELRDHGYAIEMKRGNGGVNYYHLLKDERT